MEIENPLGDRLMVGHVTLDHRIGVRLPVPQPLVFIKAHSSRGSGRRPLTAVTRVRIPYALPKISGAPIAQLDRASDYGSEG